MRSASLLLSFTISVSAFAAAPKLDRPTLAAMFAQRLRPMCTAQLTQKPEFRALRGAQVCDVSVVVTGISRSSESEAIAEWHYVLRAHLPELQRWLEAFQKFSDRMSKLKPVPAANPNSYPKFVDPSDQQEFTVVSLTSGSPNIFTSLTWLDLQKLQNRMEEVMGSDDRSWNSVDRQCRSDWPARVIAAM
jgi:hypothetical protein